MALDIELYRRIIYAPAEGTVRRLSVIDIEPEAATRTLVFIHGYGGNSSQWIYQLRFFGQSMRVIAPDTVQGKAASHQICLCGGRSARSAKGPMRRLKALVFSASAE